MGQPRFLLVSGVGAGTARRMTPHARDEQLPGPNVPWSGWRLVSSNNRELGRSPVVYADTAQCLASIARLQAAGEVEGRIALDPRSGQWVWTLVGPNGGDRRQSPLAASGRSYLRDVECRYSLTQFRAVAVDAPVAHRPVRRTRLRIGAES